MTDKRISRRGFLKGLGTAIAFPLWESVAAASGKAVPESGPRRLAFVYVPNGVVMDEWRPKTAGDGFAFPFILEPLVPYRDHLTVLSGLSQDKAYPFGDSPGDHARAAATFLTGVHIKKTSGANIPSGISADQVAAARVGRATRFRSLELGCDRRPAAGDCDSGYSCAYMNLSWSGPTTPVAKETSPKAVFERLFSQGGPRETAESRWKRRKFGKSILDFVLEDARALKGELGKADGRKLDEFLFCVRDVEQRLEAAEPSAYGPGHEAPKGTPQDFGEYIRIMEDLIVLAFQADLTRVITFQIAGEASERSYPFLDIPEGHHSLSHHQKDPVKLDKLKRIDRFHVSQFAYLLEKLRAIEEGRGSMLDNVMMVYGSCIADGQDHTHHDLPILLAGKGGGTIRAGRHAEYPSKTPLNNLYLSLLDRMDSGVESLGDSTGRLPGLSL